MYTDEPEAAYVDRLDEGSLDDDSVEVDLTGDVGAVQRREPIERANLHAILRHLREDGWPKIVIHTFVGDTGYKPLPLP